MSEELDGKGAVIPIQNEVLEVLHVIEQHADIKFEIRRYPWKRALENAAQGEGMLFGISKTQERLRSFKFSLPLFTDRAWLVTLCAARLRFHSVQDLKGKTIGIVRGTSYGDEFDRLSGILFKVEDDTSNNAGRLKKLIAGRMDAFLLYAPIANTKRLENEVNQQYAVEFGLKLSGQKLFCIPPKPVSSVDIHIAIRPDLNRGLMEKIDRAIQGIQENGELEKMNNPK